MPKTVFPYPGGKSRFASWILEFVPEHRTFVEVFGGAAGVLVNKDPDASKVEVYNDKDGDLVHFFEVLREDTEDLVEWVEQVPFSREVHERWARYYYNGYRPKDDISRAGHFFFLRYSQWGSGYGTVNGFATSKVQSRALSYANKIDRLDEFAERFRDVVLENLDWRAVLSKYDSPETVFYLDPPYVGQENYYPAGKIDHEALMDALRDLEGRAICSYEELPENVDGLHVVERGGEKRFMGNGKEGSAKEATERLVMTYYSTSPVYKR